jgi:deoxyribose-phosphate aldolase
MQLDARTLDSLVEEITRQVVATLKQQAGQTGSAVPLPAAPPACPQCDQHGVQHRPDVARQAILDGATRLSTTLGTRPVSGDVAQYIDHTLLKPDASQAQITQLCEEARQYKFATVCVNPTNVKLCSQLLRGSGVGVCVVAGFPLGATPTKVKCYEAQQAIQDGATEVDMVINVGALKSKQYDLVREDIAAVARTCHNGGASLKVIIEAALLTDDEKITACQLSKAAGADYVKTSTGFGPGGATLHDVALMRQTVGPEMGVKAAGGIKTYQDTVAMLQAGATRIGASASVKILQAARGG